MSTVKTLFPFWFPWLFPNRWVLYMRKLWPGDIKIWKFANWLIKTSKNISNTLNIRSCSLHIMFWNWKWFRSSINNFRDIPSYMISRWWKKYSFVAKHCFHFSIIFMLLVVLIINLPFTIFHIQITSPWLEKSDT